MKIDGLEKINQKIKEIGDVLNPKKVASMLIIKAEILDFTLKYMPENVNDLDYTIIEALKKQMPKEAVKSGEIGIVYVCPDCGFVVGMEGVKNDYCIKCGQRIQW